MSAIKTADLVARFQGLLAAAREQEAGDATAVALATADAAGRPAVRMVLLKGLDEEGFVFFTNYESRKAREMAENPRAALCFFWHSLGVQVRAEGRVERVSAAESEAYFATRPRGSQLAAWASQQSGPLPSREHLVAGYREVEARHDGADVPRPDFWGGYRLHPERIEFWKSGESRLHHRELYIRDGHGWRTELLYP